MSQRERIEELETQVLIVGGGLVGLCLALELRFQGIDVIVLEQTDNVVEHPRVSTIGIRAMEFARRWGIAEQIRRAGWPEDYPHDIAFVSQVGGHEILRLRFPSQAERAVPDYSPEPEQVCPQHWFIPLLTRTLNAAPEQPVKLRWQLQQVLQSADEVLVTATDLSSNRTVRLRAQYLVACDGAHSPVRKQLGVQAPHRHAVCAFLNILFRAPQLAEQMGQSRALVYFLRNPRLSCPLRAIDGQSLYRLTVNLKEGEDAPEPSAAIADAFALSTPIEILSCDRWHLVHRVAERFRKGSVFFVGDSAHCLSPFGGFGMNTGIADAVNLAWKLAACLEGWGGIALLDTYEQERRPVAERNLEETHQNLQRTQGQSIPPEILETSEQGKNLRRQMAERLRKNGVEREFDAPGVHLGAVYRSSIIASDGEPWLEDPFSWTQNSAPGGRAPHAWLAPQRSTLDLFGHGFVLLERDPGQDGTPIARAFEARGVPLTKHAIHDSATAATLYERAFILVRPDGHVAWHSHSLPDDCGRLVDHVCGHSPKVRT